MHETQLACKTKIQESSDTFQKEKSKLEQVIQLTKNELQEITLAKQELESRILMLKNEQRQTMSENQQLKTQLNEGKSYYDRLMNEKLAYQNRLAEQEKLTEKIVENLRSELKSREAEASGYQKAGKTMLKAKEDEIDHLRSEHENLKSSLHTALESEKSLKAKVFDEKAKTSSIDQKMQNMAHKMKLLHRQNDDLFVFKTKYEVLKQNLQNLESENQSQKDHFLQMQKVNSVNNSIPEHVVFRVAGRCTVSLQKPKMIYC